MEITIGWAPHNDIVVADKDVYSKHCSIEKELNGKLIVRNLNKFSKTFINDETIEVGELKENDLLKIGNSSIDYSHLYQTIESLLVSRPLDFKDESIRLRKLYDDYQNQCNNVLRKFQKKDTFIKVCFSLVPLISSLIIKKEFGFSPYALGSVCSGIVTWLSFQNNSNLKSKEELNKIKLEFLLKYRCPKCNVRFGDIDWRLIEDQGRCNSCKTSFANPLDT